MRLRFMLTAGVLAALSLGSHADPPRAVPVEEEPQAGFTTQLRFSYRGQGGAERERTIFLWYPSAAPAKDYRYRSMQDGRVAVDGPLVPGRHPLVVFSHGFWGAADQTIFLMEALARAGYLVASVHHDDAIPNHRKEPVELPNFVNAKAWDDAMFFDRKEDMSALLDELFALDRKAGSLLHERVRREAVGAAGHSLGGYTALGLAGARPAWKDERIAAALLLSPYVHPYYFHGDLEAVKVPVMFQGGTLDLGVTPFLKSIYDRLPASKYFCILRKVGHYGWTNFATSGQRTTEVLQQAPVQLIADYGVAFFDQHLRGVDRRDDLTRDDDGFFRWWAKP